MFVVCWFLVARCGQVLVTSDRAVLSMHVWMLPWWLSQQSSCSSSRDVVEVYKSKYLQMCYDEGPRSLQHKISGIPLKVQHGDSVTSRAVGPVHGRFIM